MLYGILTVLLFGLSFFAGLMGPGVAFIATPVLRLIGCELLISRPGSVPNATPAARRSSTGAGCSATARPSVGPVLTAPYYHCHAYERG